MEKQIQADYINPRPTLTGWNKLLTNTCTIGYEFQYFIFIQPNENHFTEIH